MNTNRLTYHKLFALLSSLGFQEELPSDNGPNQPRAFVHDQTETVLLFRNSPGETVSSADILSTEVHLHAKNIVDQPLESLLNAIPVNK